ncbi:MAG: hypothetical protein H6979_10640 [Chromatiales bacterium]|nr:hypothetical protein [Chromatiales bacterium]
MTRRQDFSAEEWRALRNAPQLVAIATAAAGHSGFFGTLSEGMSAASAFAAARRANNELIKELFGPEEIRAAHGDIGELLGSVTEPSAFGTQLQDGAIAATRKALAALGAHQATADMKDYRKMLAWLAEEVANAAREGSFFGFGGVRVSEGEQKFLDKLYAVVKTGDAAP